MSCAHRNKSSMHLVIILSASLTSSWAAAHESAHSPESLVTPGDYAKTFQIHLDSAVNAMHEHCEFFPAGGLLSFSFNSVHPVNFDIHHHTDSATITPIERSEVSSLDGELLIEAGIEYCFNFVNQKLQETPWEFPVNFDISSLVDASR